MPSSSRWLQTPPCCCGPTSIIRSPKSRPYAGAPPSWPSRCRRLRLTAYRAISALQEGRIPGPEAGLGKIAIIEAGRKGAELGAELLGPSALNGELGELAAEMPGMRSAGGTEEILRNTIGERVLGLPAEPRGDKTMPYSELSRSGRQEVAA
ncbi:acyl-CoA dehydrogenase family protein [Conexibacter sp. W3-3-2]|uniref:acyl-CoA dehydrogenase family protein n=1 Tax=Conexibacter sp. W3-3-2 TaxID=2675227 RepID=UPI001E3BE31F|nr:acyl-CoA dehydrogenase family protein [Conexibacter sp. W3-3-2]